MKRTARQQPILQTKLQAPRPKPDTLKRQRLLSFLGNQLDRRLLVITGDAGYGKTTLLAQIGEQAHLPGVFLSLEAGDSDLVTFFACLISGLERLQPGLAKRCLVLLDQGTDIGENPRLAMGTLLNELVEKRNEELFIFLDDYHALSDESEVHQALDYFIDHLPASVHVVLASRKEPPLPSLPKWRSKRDLAELTREALKFTEDEIKDLLATFYHISLSDPELRGITQRTEGWITGVQLILQAAGRDGKSVSEILDAYLDEHGDLFQYFAQEIFNREQPEIKAFLMRSAILERVTADVCQTVLNEKEAETRLEKLEKDNLFVTVTGDEVYRYHRLFREFLLNKGRADPAITQLQRAAAGYYLEMGDRESAVGHLLEAGEFAKAAVIIGELADGMRRSGRFMMLDNWLQRLPQEIIDCQPGLLLVVANRANDTGRLDEAERRYQQIGALVAGMDRRRSEGRKALAESLHEQAHHLWRQGSYPAAMALAQRAMAACPPGQDRLRGHIVNLIGSLWLELGQPEKYRRHYVTARRLFSRSGDRLGLVVLEANRITALDRMGDIREAFESHQRFISAYGGEYIVNIGIYFFNAVRTAINLGKIDWAESCLKQGWDVCLPYDDDTSRAMLEQGFAMLYLHQGRWEQAERHITVARELASRLGWTRPEYAVLRMLVRLYRYQARYDEADRWLETMRQKLVGTETQLGAMYLAEQGLLAAAQGKLEKASASLNEARRLSQRLTWKVGELLSCLGLADAASSSGKATAARRWLLKAIAIAKLGYDGLLSCELLHSGRLQQLAVCCHRERRYLLSIPAYQPGGAAAPVTAEKAGLRVDLMGIPRLSAGGKDITGELRRQALQMLCYLAYHGERGCDRDQILAAMWPRSKATQAVDNFHLVLYEIRQGLKRVAGKAFDRAVVKERGCYRISAKLRLEVDAIVFDALLAEAREAERSDGLAAAKELLIRALGMKRGEFCSGWTGNWAQELSRRYEDLHQKALLKLGALHLRDGDLERSAECYRTAVGRDELCEEAYRGLLRIHGAQGSRPEAAEAFAMLRSRLRKALHVDPADETVQLYRAIMNEPK